MNRLYLRADFRALFLASILVILGLLPPSSVFAAWIVDAAIEGEYNDNYSNSGRQADAQSDFSIKPSLSAGIYHQVANYTGIAVLMDFTSKHFAKYKQINKSSVGVSGTISQKLGLGPSAIRIDISGAGSYDDYGDRYRDSIFYNLDINISKWLTERMNLEAGYAFDSRVSLHTQPAQLASSIVTPTTYITYKKPANHGSITKRDSVEHSNISRKFFDLRGHTLHISSQYMVSNSHRIQFSYRIRGGDIVSSARTNSAGINNATAWGRDFAFDDYYIYRIDATAHSFSFLTNHAIQRKVSFNIEYVYNRTFANGGGEYVNNILRCGFIYSF